MFRLNLKFVVACMVVLFAGVACSGNSGIRLADIPKFKDAEEVDIEASTNLVVKAADKALKDAAEGEGLTADSLVFAVPEGKTWDNIKTFYVEELKGEWTENDALMAKDTSGVQHMTWTRKGFLTRDQILVLAWVDDKETGAKFYMVMLYTK